MIIEKYRIYRKLGNEESGSVHLSEDVDTKELYAIKKVK
jgi:serine/threonine protein kinase